MRDPISLETSDGLYLPALDLWLDPHRPRENAFVSHAHADHFARHENIFCSEPTAILLRHRYKVAPERLHPHPWHQPLQVGDHQLQLLPAGHIVGSAMLHVTRTTDGATLLYTGDFKVRPGFTAEQAVFRRADTLVMETTFGKPEFVFPSLADLTAAIRNFVEDALEDGSIPVLLGYSLGKAQEAAALLTEARLPFLSHPTVAEMTEACRAAGAGLPPPILFESEVPPGHALVCPPNAVRSKSLRSLPDTRLAVLSGWGLNPGAKFRYRADEVFPLSDHADYPGLLECVTRVSPRRILTVHGFAREFAADLRQRGWEAWSIHGDDQIELGLGRDLTSRPRHSHTRPSGEVKDFTDLCARLSATASRSRKRDLLAGYLSALPDPSLQLAAAWLSGRALPASPQRALHLDAAVIRTAILQVTRLSPQQYRQLSSPQSNPAGIARLLLETARLGPQGFDFATARSFLEELAATSASLQLATLLAHRFRSLHPRESECLVRVLTGDLRLGLKEGLLEEALALAFARPLAQVRRAHLLLGNLAETALRARHNTLRTARLQPFAPLRCMLATPESSPATAWKRAHPASDPAPSSDPPAASPPLVWNEDKLDGIRAHLHRQGGEAALFARDLRPLDSQFPELLAAARLLPADVILDGEIIASAGGRPIRTLELPAKGRPTPATTQGDLFLGPSVPLRFVVFDLLWHNGQDLLDQPLAIRRLRLETLRLPPAFELVEVRHANSPLQLERHFQEAVARGNEGLVLKDPTSHYRPGHRGKAWLKLRNTQHTLDCVVVAARPGHPARPGLLSEFTLAVRDDASGALLTIGNASAGLPDSDLEELTRHFEQSAVRQSPRGLEVEPTIVLEIAFDSLRPSRRHSSGLALRFPRILAIRRDKPPHEIDTLRHAQSLCK